MIADGQGYRSRRAPLSGPPCSPPESMEEEDPTLNPDLERKGPPVVPTLDLHSTADSKAKRPSVVARLSFSRSASNLKDGITSLRDAVKSPRKERPADGPKPESAKSPSRRRPSFGRSGKAPAAAPAPAPAVPSDYDEIAKERERLKTMLAAAEAEAAKQRNEAQQLRSEVSMLNTRVMLKDLEREKACLLYTSPSPRD